MLSAGLCYSEYLGIGSEPMFGFAFKVPVLKHQILIQMIINTGKI